MTNPEFFCTKCKKMHTNPVIKRFNEFLAHVCQEAPPAACELDMYRAYAAGCVDVLLIMSLIADRPMEEAGTLVNNLAVNVRDAVLNAIDDPLLKKTVKAALTISLAIREEDFCGN